MSRVRCQRCANGIDHDFFHGANGYREHRCRCDECTEGHRVECWKYNNERGGLARNRARYSPEKRRSQYHSDLDRISERNREYARRNQPRFSVLGKEWRARNPGANSAAYRRRMDKRSRLKAENNRQKWSPQDDAIAMSNLSVLEIAHTLGRSYSAVETRRRVLRQNEEQTA